MTVYIITREGIYRHEILGVYMSLEEARERASLLAACDNDDWHNYEVGKAELGVGCEDVVKVGEVKKGTPWQECIRA